MSRASLSDIEFSRNLPMKLNEKFYPLPKNTVYSSLMSPVLFPESLLEDDISFDAENRAIDQFFDAQQRKLREKEQEPKVFHEQPSTSNEHILKSVVIDSNAAAATRDLIFSPFAKKLLAIKGAVESPTQDSILKPTPVGCQNFTPNVNHNHMSLNSNKNNNGCIPEKSSTTATLKKSKSTALVRLEDFELNQSSPFDTMELKTLDVFEELKQILSASSSSSTDRKIESNDRPRIT